MKRLLVLEWRKLRSPVIGTIIFESLLSMILCSIIYKSYALENQLEVWEVGFEIIDFLFALFAVLPTCWLLYFERKNEYLKYTLPRVSKKRYILSKWIVISASAFSIFFIMSMVGVVTALYLVPPIDVFYSSISPDTGEPIPTLINTHFAGEMFTQQPLLYGFLLSAWKGLLCVFVSTMGFVFSLYSKNLFVILTGPFVYIMVENFAFSVLGIPQFRFVTAFEPTSISLEAINIGSFLFGPFFILFITGLYVIYSKYVAKASIYNV